MESKVSTEWWIIFYIIYFRLFWIYLEKKHETVTDDPSIMMYVNKIENRITFKTKTGYYLELLMLETLKVR